MSDAAAHAETIRAAIAGGYEPHELADAERDGLAALDDLVAQAEQAATLEAEIQRMLHEKDGDVELIVQRAYRAEERAAKLEAALAEAERRFVMIEDEGEAANYKGDSGVVMEQFVHTLGVMAGIAERGKDEARAALKEET